MDFDVALNTVSNIQNPGIDIEFSQRLERLLHFDMADLPKIVHFPAGIAALNTQKKAQAIQQKLERRLQELPTSVRFKLKIVK